jgi:hypothetical protein
MPNCREQKHQERGEAQGAGGCVQCCLALQEMLGEFGVFVQGGIEEALVGGEDSGRSRSVYVVARIFASLRLSSGAFVASGQAEAQCGNALYVGALRGSGATEAPTS